MKDKIHIGDYILYSGAPSPSTLIDYCSCAPQLQHLEFRVDDITQRYRSQIWMFPLHATVKYGVYDNDFNNNNNNNNNKTTMRYGLCTKIVQQIKKLMRDIAMRQRYKGRWMHTITKTPHQSCIPSFRSLPQNLSAIFL